MIATGAWLGYQAVDQLHKQESDQRAQPITLRPSLDGQELIGVRLREGDDAIIEVCAQDGFDGPAWQGSLAFQVLYEPAGAAVARLALNEAIQRTSTVSDRACVTVADAQSVPAGGRFVLRATWGEPAVGASAIISARARSFPGQPWTSHPWFWLILFGNIAWLVSRSGTDKKTTAVESALQAEIIEDEEALDSFLRGDSIAPKANTPASDRNMAWLRLVFGIGAMILVLEGLGAILRPGRLGVLEAGLALALCELLVAVAMSLPKVSVLALGLPRSARWWLLAAPFLGLGARLLGGWLAPFFPATGRSPVEVFVEWPSGVLALAVVALVAPVAEEVFFRGFVFGWVRERAGDFGGFVVSVVLFALAHAPQTWGAWGSLVAIVTIGITTSGLRWISGSTLVAVVAHLAYNLVIVVRSIF